jgi:hypothetical protein
MSWLRAAVGHLAWWVEYRTASRPGQKCRTRA